jgi:outer membrane autotransporter protein
VAVPVAHALDIVCAENDATFSAACRALTSLDDATLTSTLQRVAPQQSAAQAKVATEFVAQINDGIQSRLRTLRGGARRFDIQKLSLNLGGRPIPVAMMSALMPQTASSTDEPDYNGWSGFLSGNLGTGQRPRDNGIIGFDLDTQGLMVGADRQIGDGVLGISANFANFGSTLNDAAGKVDTSAYAVSLYGSRGGLRASAAPSAGSGMHYDGLHFDGSLTFGQNNHDSEHVVDVPGLPLSRAHSKNSAITYAMAAAAGADLHSGRTDLELAINTSWSRTNIHNLTESGDGPLILFVQGRGVDSFLTSASVNVRSVWATSFGDLLPSFRAELLHDAESGARLITARFLRDTLNTPFTVPLDEPDANYGKLSAGLQAVFAHGVSAFLEVTQDVARTDLHFRTVQFNVSKSF